MNSVNCAACGLPIESDDYNDRHWGHVDGCEYQYSPSDEADCDCDIEYHAKCCPECNEERINERTTVIEQDEKHEAYQLGMQTEREHQNALSRLAMTKHQEEADSLKKRITELEAQLAQAQSGRFMPVKGTTVIEIGPGQMVIFNSRGCGPYGEIKEYPRETRLCEWVEGETIHINIKNLEIVESALLRYEYLHHVFQEPERTKLAKSALAEIQSQKEKTL